MSIVLLVNGCVTAYVGGAMPATVLTIDAAVQESPAGDRARVIAKVTNAGSVAVAVCRCFGMKRLWTTVEVTNLDGSPVDLHPPDWDLFSTPPYECLQPGKSFTLRKDLFHWFAQFGDAVLYDWGADSYRIPAGQYWLRVGYKAQGAEEGLRCRHLKGATFSPPVALTIKTTTEDHPK